MTPKMINLYRKDYEQKKQEEADMIDYAAWLNGLYVLKAIGVVMSKNKKYPSQRIGIIEKQKSEVKDSVRFGAFAATFNANRKRKSGEKSAE